MAYDEEQIRLLLELLGFDKLESAIAGLSHLKGTATEAQAAIEGDTYAVKESFEAYHVMTSAINEADVAMDKMVADAVAATQAQKAVAVAIGAAGEAAETSTTAFAGAGRGAGGYAQNVQALGYAVNDFFSVSGDMSQRLTAISNNIPLIAAGFGGIGVAIGAILPIAAQLIKHWDDINGMMAGNTFKVPEATDELARLTDQLKAVTKQIGDLKDKQNLTNWELEQYNKLSGEQIILEEKKNAALEKRKALDMLAGLRPEEEAKRAAGFKKAVGEAGGGEGVASALRQALFNIGQATGQEFTLEGIAQQADDLMVEASKGSKEAIETIRKAMRQGLPENQQKIADLIQGSTPEAEQERKKGEQVQKDREIRDRDEFNATVEGLNEQGKANEKALAETEKEQEEIARNLAASRAEMEQDRQRFREKLARLQEGERKAIDKFLKDRADPDKAIQRQAAAQIQAGTGVDDAQAMEGAQRSLQLQKQGWDAINATQQAMAEIMAAQNGMMQQYQVLQQRAAMMTAQIRRMGAREANQDQIMPAMQFGWSF